MTEWLRAGAGALLGAAVILAGTAAARAEDDDPSFDQKIINNVLTTLGVRGGGADIDYRERSPLVLPPRIQLPPPQANATAGARNWPVDPDAKRRREEANRRRDEVEESRPLRPSELNVGERTRNGGPAPTQEQIEGRPSRPSELGFGGGLFRSVFGSKEEVVQFKEEPPRTSLIEPPAGYQTPSPDQPYTAKSERFLPQIPSFFDFGTAAK